MKIGNLDISSFKVGGADCSIYLGDTKLYPTDVPPTPTDNWVLVDENGVNSPRKVKVDYSLIEDDDSAIRDDYDLGSHDLGTYEIIYLNQPTLEWMMQEGYGGDELAEYYQKVGLFSSSDGIIGILEDGVEYASIGGINLSYFYMSPTSDMLDMSNYYLYATQ